VLLGLAELSGTGGEHSDDVRLAARGVLACFAGMVGGVVLVFLATSLGTLLLVTILGIGFFGFCFLLNESEKVEGR
jgi:hypothetical protein